MNVHTCIYVYTHTYTYVCICTVDKFVPAPPKTVKCHTYPRTHIPHTCVLV